MNPVNWGNVGRVVFSAVIVLLGMFAVYGFRSRPAGQYSWLAQRQVQAAPATPQQLPDAGKDLDIEKVCECLKKAFCYYVADSTADGKITKMLVFHKDKGIIELQRWSLSQEEINGAYVVTRTNVWIGWQERTSPYGEPMTEADFVEAAQQMLKDCESDFGAKKAKPGG